MFGVATWVRWWHAVAVEVAGGLDEGGRRILLSSYAVMQLCTWYFLAHGAAVAAMLSAL
jgi:hypothetical protein